MNPSFFGLDALGCVRHFHQPLLGDQLAGGFADAVCLVLDAYERHFEVADKFHLMGSQTTGKLIPKERLMKVPHATECIEAKEGRR